MTAVHGHPHTLEELEEICQQRGGWMTRQRRAVLNLLLASKRPVSAYDLRDALLPDDPSITPAAVYRSLDFLVEHGLVHRLETTRSFVACDHPDHPHSAQFLVCRQCGSVVEAEDKRFDKVTESLGQRLGFTLDHRAVELTGVCAACNAADGAINAPL
jgi:Fur family transcriptional regulator, zinc uptake regulator